MGKGREEGCRTMPALVKKGDLGVLEWGGTRDLRGQEEDR